MKRGRRWLVLLLGWLAVTAQPLWAHGGGTPVLTNATAGPYLVSVWMSPDPLRVGTVHLTVAVIEAASGGENGPPVLEATVGVRARPLAGDAAPIVTEATHAEALNKILYETDFEVPQAGRWEIALAIEGPDGPAEVNFSVEVLPSSRRTGWLIGGGAGVLILLIGWMAARRRRSLPAGKGD
ncbi:MAG: hypothetical protein D6796_02980 [Caldilineae bacterium]|nr:MAG: hypothetical protein D6796_02980 [Caldilineae bacterium]